MRRALFAALLVSTLSFACGDPSKNNQSDAGAPPLGLTPEQAARVVAKVGDRAITLGEYAETLDRMDPFDRLRYQTTEKRRELLTEMIDLELLAIEAKKRGLDKTPEAQDGLRQVLRDALLAEARRKLPTPAEIPASEVAAYFEANQDKYSEPERRRVSAVVLTDEKKALEVLEAAKKTTEAAAWGKLVFENSLAAGQDKKEGVPLDLAGDLGIVGPPGDARGANPKVPEAVRTAVFGLAKVGDVHPTLVKEADRFYIVRLNGMTAGHKRGQAEADRQIRVELLKQKLKKLEEDLEAELRKKHTVSIDDAVLAKVSTAAIVPPAPAPIPSAAPVAPSASPAPAPSASAAP